MVALDYNGSIWICGGNESGQLSQGFANLFGQRIEEHKILHKIEIDTQFIDVSAGKTNYFFSIDSDGHLWSCGSNKHGKLGQNISQC